MVINDNNSHINSFTKGMNSDGAFDQIANTQYIFGQNIRITKNQFLGGSNDYSSVHEGIVTPVPVGTDITKKQNVNIVGNIISVQSIERLGVIVTAEGKNMHVYKIEVDERTNECTKFKQIWHANNLWKGEVPEKISTVLYKELENVIKLYIADGEHPIISLRVDDDSEGKYESNGVAAGVDDLINNRIIPKQRVKIIDVISGRLTTSQVQYTYRCYNKYGNSTQLAPLTNKIQVIDPSRSKESGNAENTETSIGLSISIDISEFSDYDRLQVYRLSYIIPGQDAEVDLIYDGNIKKDDGTINNPFVLNDVGIDPLQKLSMEEFAAMSGLILVPQVIEQNQEYMFCANVKDDTIIKGTITPSSTKPTIVQASVVLSDKISGDIPDHGNHSYYNGEYNNIKDVESGQVVSTVSDYFSQRGVSPELVKANYNNIFTSSLLRSLRRGETYKYAIVFYDKYGRRTDVKNIHSVDIKEYGAAGYTPFDIENGSLIAKPLGVRITIPQFTPSEGSKSDIIGCQIVRRSSSEIYQRNLLQVALARPISQGLLDLKVEDLNDITSEDQVKNSPYYPSGFLSVSALYIVPHYYTPELMQLRYAEPTSVMMSLPQYKILSAHTKNHKLYQIFSSEIDFRRNDVLSRINTSDSVIQEVCYMHSVFSRYTNGTKHETYNGTFPIENSLDVMEASTVSGSAQPTSYSHISMATAGPDEKRWYYIDRSYIDTTKSVIFSFENSDVSRGTLLYIDTAMQGGTTEDHIIYGPDITIGQDLYGNWHAINFINTAINNNYPLYISVVNQDAGTLTISVQNRSDVSNEDEGFITIRRDRIKKLSSDEKHSLHYIFNFFINAGKSGFGSNNVNQIKDVKIPNWDSGFTEVQTQSGAQNKLYVSTAVKKYKSFSTNIDSYTYNNWVSFGKYDLRPGKDDDSVNMDGYENYNEGQELIGAQSQMNFWKEHTEEDARNGYIAAGPSCFLLTTQNETGMFPLNQPRFYTSICNIQHSPKLTDVQSDDFTQYFGFGNYFNLTYDPQKDKFLCNNKEELIVFDGDVYITPHEFTTMYKAYDFNSVDTLQSTQIVNYVPLESKVNTYFDYGMNMMNTQSENLIYEPGHIDGVTTQDRPAHQYNMIYSDNDASNDVFTLISTDQNETNQFKQRAYYSDLKTNGEFIDNFLIFKAASFIDVNAQYGQITNMLTDKNALYYWQDYACGKFSVNERSLINDQNSNTIMLGQAGILSRYDYISTRYGMRLHDFCARSTEGGVFWVDINNKAIAALAENKAVNYGEQLGVQNIVNNRITQDVPYVDYDVQNDEVLCKCFGEDQIIFNIKYNLATSLYTRRYDDILYIKNHIYGLTAPDGIRKYNYLDYNNNNHTFLHPLQLSFVVNPMASVTKVFDSQQLVPIKRDAFVEPVDNTYILDPTTMSFETDIVRKTYGDTMEPYTDREGNIIYNVPRYTVGEGYGNRIRGKWMRVNINNDNPTEYFTISHIITKFRQSYS